MKLKPSAVATIAKRALLATVAAITLATGAHGDAVGQQSKNAAPTPITLEDYAAQNDLGKPAGVQFVSLRCASLYLFSSGTLQDQSPDMAAKFEHAAKLFVAAALTAAKNQEDFVKDQLPRMLAMYGDRARAAKAATGSVFDDPILRSDILFCKRIAS